MQDQVWRTFNLRLGLLTTLDPASDKEVWHWKNGIRPRLNGQTLSPGDERTERTSRVQTTEYDKGEIAGCKIWRILDNKR